MNNVYVGSYRLVTLQKLLFYGTLKHMTKLMFITHAHDIHFPQFGLNGVLANPVIFPSS